MHVVLDKFGRILIPKAVRKRLGLRPGVKLEIEERSEKIILKTSDSAKSLKVKEGVLVFSGLANQEELKGEISKAREQRIRVLSP